MAADQAKHSYPVEMGEKVTPVMIYTSNMLLWGDVVTKEAMRVSNWLRSPAAPKYIFLHDAQALVFGGGGTPKPQPFQGLLLPQHHVIAFHIKPPAHDPVEFEASEINRKMEPTTALVGSFRFDGTIRMATLTSLDRFLDVSKEDFTALYDVEITNPSLPAMGVIRVPFVLLRSLLTLFSTRSAPPTA